MSHRTIDVSTSGRCDSLHRSKILHVNMVESSCSPRFLSLSMIERLQVKLSFVVSFESFPASALRCSSKNSDRVDRCRDRQLAQLLTASSRFATGIASFRTTATSCKSSNPIVNQILDHPMIRVEPCIQIGSKYPRSS